MDVPQWARNYQLGHSIFGLAPYPDGRGKYTVDRVTAKGFATNVLREVSVHFGTPSESLNQRFTVVLRRLIQTAGQDPDDPATTKLTFFIPKYNLDEYFVGSPVHLTLAFVVFGAIVFSLRRSGQTQLWLALGITGAFFLYCLGFKFEIWCARLHLPLLVLATPVVATFLCQRAPKVVPSLAGLLFLLALPPLLFNKSRPLLSIPPMRSYAGQPSMFRRDRWELYFEEEPTLRQVYVPAAAAVRQENCSDVGVDTSAQGYSFEYPFFVLAQSPQRHARFRYTDVRNLSSKYIDDTDRSVPCAVACFDCAHNAAKWTHYSALLPRAETFGSLVVFFPSRSSAEAR